MQTGTGPTNELCLSGSTSGLVTEFKKYQN